MILDLIRAAYYSVNNAVSQVIPQTRNELAAFVSIIAVSFFSKAAAHSAAVGYLGYKWLNQAPKVVKKIDAQPARVLTTELERRVQEVRQAVKEIDAPLLTTRMKKHPMRETQDIEQFLNAFELHVQRFNAVHWATFCGKLYVILDKGIRLESGQPKRIEEMLSLLPNCKEKFSPGQVAQVIGACLPFTTNNARVESFLIDLLREAIGGLKKKEMFMIIHGARKAQAHNFSALIYDRVMEMRDLDLDVAFFHLCGRLGIFKDQFFEMRIFPNIENLSLERLGEILESIGIQTYYGRNYQPYMVEKLGDLFSKKVMISSDNKAIKRNILKGMKQFSFVKYQNFEWVRFCLRQLPKFKMKDQMRILSVLIRLGVNRSNLPQVGGLLKSLAKEHCLSEKSPEDQLIMASVAAVYFKSEEKETTHRLIKLALPHAKDKDRRSMLHQAIMLTDFPLKDAPLDIQNHSDRQDVSESHTQKMVQQEFERRMSQDRRFSKALLKSEVEGGHSPIDIVIEGFSKDGRPIAIEVDGPSHRAINARVRYYPQGDIGKTQVKHHLVQKAGYHLVVIRTGGLREDPHLNGQINRAWDQIVKLG